MSLAGNDLNRLRLVDVTERATAALGPLLDLMDRAFGLLFAAVHQKPARTLGEVLAHEEDDEPERRTEQESDSPRVAHRQVVHHEDGEHGGDERAAPIGAVHSDVHPAAVLGRDQLVDGRVDGRIFTTDSHAGDEPGSPEPVDPESRMPERAGSHEATEKVDTQRDHEEVASAELVGHPAEEECSGHLTQEIDGADGERHFGRREVEGLLLADEAFGVAGDGDLETVEYPRHTEGYDQTRMEARPTQPVQARWNEAPDHSWRVVSIRPLNCFDAADSCHSPPSDQLPVDFPTQEDFE